MAYIRNILESCHLSQTPTTDMETSYRVYSGEMRPKGCSSLKVPGETAAAFNHVSKIIKTRDPLSNLAEHLEVSLFNVLHPPP